MWSLLTLRPGVSQPEVTSHWITHFMWAHDGYRVKSDVGTRLQPGILFAALLTTAWISWQLTLLLSLALDLKRERTWGLSG